MTMITTALRTINSTPVTIRSNRNRTTARTRLHTKRRRLGNNRNVVVTDIGRKKAIVRVVARTKAANDEDDDVEEDERTSVARNSFMTRKQQQKASACLLMPYLVFAPKAFAQGAFEGVTKAISSPEFHELSMYTIKTLISWGVPAVTVGIVGLMILSSARRGRTDTSSFSNSNKNSGPFGFLKGAGGVNRKPRTQPYLSITRLNDRLDAYALQFEAATVSKTSARRQQSKNLFEKKYAEALGDNLTAEERTAILEAQKKWKEVDEKLKMQMNAISAKSRKTALMLGASSKKDSSSDSDNKSSSNGGNFMNNLFTGGKENIQAKEVGKIASERMLNEDKYLTAVAKAIGKSKLKLLEEALQDPNNQTFGWQANSDVLLLNNVDEVSGPKDKLTRKHVFVIDFFGDVQASQAAQLREEVTGLLRSAKKERGDEVILRLNTGGGTVTGYGLAAAQLTRIKSAGLPLTICVEQVAASGGYMMACVADKIVASPFAVLGSIGVISDVPNVYERLRKEGIEFATITAGKYKRTITPTKKITKEDLAKTTRDIEDVLSLFKGFVATNRPSLNIDDVATGETWFGMDAMKKGLCDELKTSDDVLLDLLPTSEIFSVKLKSPAKSPLSFAGIGGSSSSSNLLAYLVSSAAQYYYAKSSITSTTKNPSTGGFGFQAIDREADNFMMLDQSYSSTTMSEQEQFNFGYSDDDLEDSLEEVEDEDYYF